MNGLAPSSLHSGLLTEYLLLLLLRHATLLHSVGLWGFPLPCLLVAVVQKGKSNKSVLGWEGCGVSVCDTLLGPAGVLVPLTD